MDSQIDAVLYFSTSFAIAFSAGIARAVRDNKWRTRWHGLAIGVVTGFLGFAVVTVLDSYSGQRGPLGLGVAALVGLAGRELNDLIVKRLINKVLPDKK